MTLRLGGDGAITGCTSLEEPTLSVSGLLVTTPIVATSGTVAAPSYTFTGDTNTGFYQPNGDAIGASLGGAERAILDSSSNNTWLLIKSGASLGNGAELFLGNSYSEGSIAYSHGTGNANRNLMFKTAGTEKMRLDSYGNLGLGVSPNNVNNFKTFTLAGITGGNIEFQDGGTLIGSIYNLADQFIIQGQGSTIPVAFRTNSTERMRIAADGNIGIGTTSPAKALEIFRDSFPCLMLNDGDQYKSYMQLGGNDLEIRGSSGTIEFYTGSADGLTSTERMRITSGGLIGMGYSVAAAHGLLTLAQSASSFLNALVIQQGNTGFTNSDGLHIGISTGVDAYMMHKENRAIFFGTSDVERMRIDSSGNVIFKRGADAGNILQITGADTTSETLEIGIASGGGNAQLTATNAAGGSNTCGLILRTRGTSGTTERMRINSVGEVLIGKTGNSTGSTHGTGVQLIPGSASSVDIVYNASSNVTFFHAYNLNATNNGYRFYVASDGGIRNFSGNNANLSDEREKKNIVDMDSTWSDLKQWTLRQFHFNHQEDTEDKSYGVIAQQIETVTPQVLSSFKKDDTTTRKGVKEQKMIWMAIKALQEAMAKIETLEAKVAALET